MRYGLVTGMMVMVALAGAAGCNAIVGIEEGILIDNGVGGSTAECLTVADCSLQNTPCKSALSCEQGKCVFTLSSYVPCYTGPAGTLGHGLCKAGAQQCDTNGQPVGACEGEIVPQPETCDAQAIDDDCDGKVNEEGADCFCGDGYISNAEQCDDGNSDSTDLCTTDCKKAACGDGIIQPQAGETCDDGGTGDGDSCSPICEEQRVLQVVGGKAHTCARLSGGRIKCWGHNSSGQLGLGDTNDRGDEPGEMGQYLLIVNLGTSKTTISIAAGDYHTCALFNDGSVKCWGQNDSGQLGLGDTSNRGDNPGELGVALPTIDLGTGRSATAISAGTNHTCALLNDGSVKCWGQNDSGQLGLGDTNNRGDGVNEMGDALPTIALGTDKTATAIAADGRHTCALLNDSSVKCWGYNAQGQLGLGDTNNRGDGPNEMGDALPPVDLGTDKTATAFAGSPYHMCALLNDGSVKCWGYNYDGQLGLGDKILRGDGPNEMGDALPTIALGTGKTSIAVAAGEYHTCALLNDGSVKCWGNNSFGILGLGDTNRRGDAPGEMGDALPPVSLVTGKLATAISTGANHTCAVLSDSSVKCWGNNAYGQLGLGHTIPRGYGPNQMGDNLPTVKLFSPLW